MKLIRFYNNFNFDIEFFFEIVRVLLSLLLAVANMKFLIIVNIFMAGPLFPGIVDGDVIVQLSEQ